MECAPFPGSLTRGGEGREEGVAVGGWVVVVVVCVCGGGGGGGGGGGVCVCGGGGVRR